MNVYVIVRDQMTWLAPLVQYLATSPGVSRVVLVDNDTTYPPLVEWLASCPYEVSRGPNTGHWSPWHRNLIQSAPGKYVAVTDPDLELWTMPRDWATRFTRLLADRATDVCKVGPALRLDDVPDVQYPWISVTQAGHWDHEVDPDVFYAPIDTTLYVAPTPHVVPSYGPALRVAADYLVRHLPWYLTPENCPPDVRYYLNGCSGMASGRPHYRKMVGETD